MRRLLAFLITTAIAAALVACAPERSGPTFPTAPSLAWRVTAQELADGFGFEQPTLVNPNAETSGEGLANPEIRGVGDVWITAVQDRVNLAAPLALLGVEPASGEVAWTYRPEGDLVISRCASEVVDGALACLLVAPDPRAARTSVITLVNPSTGEETRRFEAPGPASEMAVDGERLLVLTASESAATITSLTAAGREVWSTDVALAPEEVDALYFASLTAGSAVALTVGERLSLLNRATGAVVLEDYRVTARFPEGGGVVLVPYGGGDEEATPAPRLVRADGTLRATYPGFEEVLGMALASVGPVFLRSPTGELVLLDGRSEEPTPTGVVLTDRQETVGALAGDDLFVWSGWGTYQAMYVHALARPGEVLAEVPADSVGAVPVVDAEAFYLATGPGPGVTISAQALEDGAPLWSLPHTLPSSPVTDEMGFTPRVGLLEDRLALVDWSSLAAFEAVPGGASTTTAPATPSASASPRQMAEATPGSVVAWGDGSTGATVVPRAAEPAAAISAGGYHSVALREDGTVAGWGWNGTGQVRVPSGLDRVTQVSAGGHVSVALTADGEVVTWGYGAATSPPQPEVRDVVAVSAGGEHVLTLDGDGAVEAWGENRYGQVTVPSDLRDVVAIDAGHFHNLALRADGTVAGWGFNGSGRATPPAGLTDVIAVSAGRYHSLALRSDGTVVAWGNDRRGRASVPPGLSDVVAVSAGYSHSLALRSNGTVVAWGDDGYGQSSVPPGLDRVVAVEAGAYHSLALRDDGTVVGWGRDLEGQSSIPQDLIEVFDVAAGIEHSVSVSDGGSVTVWGGEGSASSVPPGVSDVTQVSAGYAFSVALTSDGAVVAWGASEAAVGPPGDLRSVAVDAGWSHALAVTEDGTVVAWGSDYRGQADVPDGLADVVAVAAGGQHSLALRRDGTVVAWGTNRSGQCDVPADLTDVVAVSAGDSHSVALRRDGTVVAWGANVAGATDVPEGLTGVVAIDAGGDHNVALLADGTVVAWGSNAAGQSTVPPGLPPVRALSAGGAHTLAVVGAR